MIAITALLAMVLPNVGPIDWLEKLLPTPKRWSRAVRTAWTFPGCSVGVEIWKTYLPSPLLLIFWILASPYPWVDMTERTCPSVAARVSAVVIRVPDLKSIPKFSPLAPIASAPTSRITPDIEKNQRDAPMKSKRIGRRRLAARSAAGLRRTGDRPRPARIACVAMTAVRNETIVPPPRAKENPSTQAEAGL